MADNGHPVESYPPSKLGEYKVVGEIAEGTFGKVKLATWHVPPEQAAVAQHGAAADGADAPRRSNADGAGDGRTLDIALKVIPKRKVKGNEASVWAEMDVLKGLDHPNIVRPPLSAHMLR